MTIIGLDLGSHSASIAVWYDDKNLLEVLADDLGFRSIPCVVAFRGEETIVGHSAVSQQHKNANNTFVEVRSLLHNHEQTHCNVPVLEKDLTVEEINAIFFRNVHNQVKQQAGKIIREAVVTVPAPLDELTKKRYVEAAQAGGIRIKSFLDDSTATLLAYGFDDPTSGTARSLVVDLGWSRCTVSLYNVSNGAISPIKTLSSTDISGKIFVKALAEYCSKEFLKKNKVPVNDNKRAMVRLTRECEQVMKTLSTGGEAMIDIDSLCEGIDYSTKISRARFEDLLSIPIIHLKNLLNNLLQQANVEGNSIHYICLAGGPSAMPKVISTLKTAFPNAQFPKVRFETSEAPAIGAAVQGKHLFELGLLDNAPTELAKVPGLNRSILISNGNDSLVIFHPNSALPAQFELPVQLPVGSLEATFSILLGSSIAADPATVLGEVSFSATEDTKDEPLSVIFFLNEEGLKVNVVKGTAKESISALTFPVIA